MLTGQTFNIITHNRTMNGLTLVGCPDPEDRNEINSLGRNSEKSSRRKPKLRNSNYIYKPKVNNDRQIHRRHHSIKTNGSFIRAPQAIRRVQRGQILNATKQTRLWQKFYQKYGSFLQQHGSDKVLFPELVPLSQLNHVHALRRKLFPEKSNKISLR